MSAFRFLRLRGGIVGLVIVTFVVLLAIFGPLFAPHPPSLTIVAPGAPPSATAPLGGDFLGRDVLSRLLWGGRSVLSIAALATLLVYVLAIPLGLIAGAGRPAAEQVIMRLMDTLRVFPPLLFFIVLITGLGSGKGILIVGVAVTQVPVVTRLLHSATLEIKVRGYVEAAVARGESFAAVLRREILPNVLSPLIADSGLRFTYSILLVAGVNFLGLGLHPPAADWGLMIAENRVILSLNAWALIAPALLIGLITVGANLIGDAITRSLGRTRVGLTGGRARRREIVAANPMLIDTAGVAPAADSAGPEVPSAVPEDLSHVAVGVRDLTVRLADDTVVVDGFNMTLKRGETLGLVGESGSGKTTIALALMGYARRGMAISSGTVVVAGDLVNLGDEHAARRLRGRVISYVPQDPSSSLNPSLRVGAGIRDVLAAHETTVVAVDDVLRRVHLPDDAEFQRRFPHQISGGQQQRVAIGMAVASQPPVVVLDEPTTGLDVVTQARVLEEIERLRADHNTTMVYVSHDLAVIARVADRIGVMYAGHLVEEGPALEVLRRPRHPYTRGLLESVPDHVRPRRLHAMPGIAVGPEDRPRGCPFAPRCELSTGRCEIEMPSLSPTDPSHEVACFEWERTPPLRVRDPVPVVEVSTATTPLLDVSHLEASYRGRGERRTVVRDVSFTIAAGECVALVGESGSGKTTIARTVAGLHAADSGVIELDGQALAPHARQRTRAERRRAQIIFQNPFDSLNPRRRVIDQVARSATLLRKMPPAEAEAAAKRRLDQVRLPARIAEQFPVELSGGERQRVAIARALAADPDLLICDEITSALDVSVQAAVIDLLTELRQQLGMALLFVTHDLGVVATLCDRAVVLANGEVCEVGQVSTLLREPQHPRTRELLEAAPEFDPHLDVEPPRPVAP